MPTSIVSGAQAKPPVSKEKSWRQRLLSALLVGFACSFTFIIFGILDLVIVNRAEFPFPFVDIILPVIGVGLACALLYAGLASLLRGTAFALLLSVTLGFLLAGYLQANLLQASLQALTGEAIVMDARQPSVLINLAVWVLVISLPCLLYRFSYSVWKKAMIFLPALFVAMQLVGLAASMVTTPDLFTAPPPYILSATRKFEVSSRKNIFVFLLDRLDGKFIDELIDDDPNFLQRLDGFTHYVDYTPQYGRTYPAVANMLTGKLYAYRDYENPDYPKEAWAQATFLPTLRQHNYTTKLYTDPAAYRDAAASLVGHADNLRLWQRQLKTRAALTQLLRLSAYRYSPQIVKPLFGLPHNAFNRVYTTQPGTPDPYAIDDELFFYGLSHDGLTTQSEKNSFTFYHLLGAHAPYIIAEDAVTAGPDGSTLQKQVKGNFHILFTFFDQLKALGLYQDATILILGDHGAHQDFLSLDTYKTAGLFVKQSGDIGSPLRQSTAPVAQANFQATILQAAGIHATGDGKAFHEVAEDEKVIRKYYHYRLVVNGLGVTSVPEFYEIQGRASDFSHWIKIEQPQFTD